MKFSLIDLEEPMNSASPDKGALNKYQRWVDNVHCASLSKLTALRPLMLAKFSWVKIGHIDTSQHNLLTVLLSRILAALPNDDDVWEPPISGYFPTLPDGKRYHH